MPEYQHDPNLRNLYWTLQYDPNGLPEMRVAARTVAGSPLEVHVDNTDPIPVTLGSNTINVVGNISVPTTVNVASTPSDPVHVHLTEIGTSGLLNVPWMPIGGTANVYQASSPWIVIGNVNVTNTPSVSVSNFPVKQLIIGNINVTNTPSVSVSNFPATQNIIGNVNITNTPTVTLSSNSVTISSGIVTASQGTTPWIVIGNANITNTPTVALQSNSVTVSNNLTVLQGTTPWVTTATFTGSSIGISQLPDNAVTAFEEPLAVGITPVLQADMSYGMDTDFWGTTQLNGGNIAVVNNTWQVNSGTSAGGYARLYTSRYMTYKPGQGAMFRWTAAFTTTGGNTKVASGIDNIVQTSGPIDREDGYAVGYSGSTVDDKSHHIGFLHRRNGKVEVRTLTVTTAPTGAQNATVTLNGVAFSVAITASTSTAWTARQIAVGLASNPIASQQWDIDACGPTITLNYYSPGLKNGTYSFSSSGAGTLATASITQIVAGVSPTDVWTYVDDWDNQSVSFDPTRLNVFGLDMRWLGAGIVRLFMEDPATGKMTLMHTQHWANKYLVPHINKPSLRLVYRSGSTSGATPSQNVIVTGASIFAGIQGEIIQTGSSQSYYNLDGSTRAKDTVWHLLSIQNPTIRNNGVNKTSLILQSLTVSVKSTDPAVIYLVKNAVGTSDFIVFAPIPGTDPFLFAQYSTSSVTETLSSDTVSIVQTVGINGAADFDLRPHNVNLAPADYISVFISSTSSFNSSSVGLVWRVD